MWNGNYSHYLATETVNFVNKQTKCYGLYVYVYSSLDLYVVKKQYPAQFVKMGTWCTPMGHGTLVAITGTRILAPCHFIISFYILGFAASRLIMLAPNLEMSCSDLNRLIGCQCSSSSSDLQGDMPHYHIEDARKKSNNMTCLANKLVWKYIIIIYMIYMV